MVKNLPCNAGYVSSTPGLGSKIPQALGQWSPSAATREARVMQWRPSLAKIEQTNKYNWTVLGRLWWTVHLTWGIKCPNISMHWSRTYYLPSIVLDSKTTAAAKSLQSCLTLCDPTDGSPPGSPVPGILQARTLEWVAIAFSKAWTWKVKVKSLNHVWLFTTPWTAAYQAPPSMGFSRQEYWSGVPLPSPRLQDWVSINV